MSDDNKEYDGIRYRAEQKSPAVFRILFAVLIVWAVGFLGYYLFSGWSSQGEYAETKKAKEARLATASLKGGETGTVSTHEESETADLAALGKTEFAARCAACHGESGKGGIGPDLTSKTYKYGRSAPQVTRSVLEGRPGGMPAFQNDLSAEKVQGIVQHVLTL